MSDIKTYEYSNITEAAQRFRALRDDKDALEESIKEVNRELSFLQDRYFPKILEDREIEKVSFDGVGTIYTKQEIFVSMVAGEKGDEAPFYDWARENEPTIITPYIHPARLKAWAKERLEMGLNVPDNMLKATLFPRAILRRK